MRPDRRRFNQSLLALTLAACFPSIALGQSRGDFSQLKTGYAQRLKKLLAAGKLPFIDIESSCNSSKVDIEALAQSMDHLDIGLMALSADIGKGQSSRGIHFDNLSERLLAAYPDRFVPVGNGGQPPELTQAPAEFLAAQESAALSRQILLLGEYEFRHYPSPRQVNRGETDRDIHIPIDGPIGHQLFSLSERLGIPFQIHYEIEDELLAPLEKMLMQYPGAKVIWCHLAQVRYGERASRYTPGYVDALIGRFAHLYFDTAFGDWHSIYPPSNQRHARVWNGEGRLAPEWRDLIVAHPQRFLSALDLGQDRLYRIAEYSHKHRIFLSCLPEETQHQVAYRNAWALLFGEEFS